LPIEAAYCRGDLVAIDRFHGANGHHPSIAQRLRETQITRTHGSLLARIVRTFVAAITLGFLASWNAVFAQDIEPRAYSNAPIGVNFLIVGYGYTRDGVAFDPDLPVTDDHLHTSNAVLGYARVLDFWGTRGSPDAPSLPASPSSASSTVSGIPCSAFR
jgi:hypothetical protein